MLPLQILTMMIIIAIGIPVSIIISRTVYSLLGGQPVDKAKLDRMRIVFKTFTDTHKELTYLGSLCNEKEKKILQHEFGDSITILWK